MPKTDLKYTDVMRPEDISIAHCWTMFAGAVMEPGAPAIQRIEMRRAFYAGFSEAFKIMVDLSGELTEKQATAILDGLHKETLTFFEQQMAEMEKSRR